MRYAVRHIILSLAAVCTLVCTLPQTAHAQFNTDRITAIGRNALYFDDYVLAIQYFNMVIKLKPYLPEPYLLRAIAKIQLSDYHGALSDLNTAIQRNPFQPGAFYTRGYVYRQMGEPDKAEADFTQALVFAPENKTYMILRADARSAKKEYDKALEDIDFLLHREPKAPSLLFEKGAICLAKEDTVCAYEHFKQTVEYDSQNPHNWSALGLVSMYLDREDEALDDLNHAISLGSKWAGDYINRGILHYKQHNYRGALADYDQAVTLSPRDAQCYYNRGMLRAEVGDWNRALEDFNQAVELAPDKTEMRYQRGVVLIQLRQWQKALDDMKEMIARYPYFLPSYSLAARASSRLGDEKEAFRYRKTAAELEEQHQKGQTPNTGVQPASEQPKKRDRRKEFSTRIAQNETDNEQDNNAAYTSETRGNIQKRYTDIINEPNINLSYYKQPDNLRRTNYYHYAVDNINHSRSLPSPLRLAVQELTLTANMVNIHFDQISRLTDRIDLSPDLSPQETAMLYFARAMEFALVQDYLSAVDDATRALQSFQYIRPSDFERETMAVITFCRANWRYRQITIQQAGNDNGDYNEYNANRLAQRQEMDYEIMFRDYDYVISQMPDFSFAYYNKANMLCAQKDYKAAIQHYTQAIAADPEFAEAYFNRGLTHIFIDEVEEGIQDLSKAGELGIYQAYNIITRME